ncbi:calcium-binding protein [Salipiger mangrovisoli]|uniref:Hemolysin-type calcium-binding repeat-containing protein n=1 Tax=Salipiger mangrovisoli TaxID=2865933 RepID=A0ABR9X5U1_9RHOB|nr:calcium-binding protein [Salipiger mangrovisoli]MBE9638807.1 hypothetical protein [Salipiger mangrovisoli]
MTGISQHAVSAPGRAAVRDIVALGEESHADEPLAVLGTNGPDDIQTGGGPQYILGLNGADVIHAGGGPDEVEGGNGSDALYGQGGPDTLRGGKGEDTLEGGPSPDLLEGGNGDDVLAGGIAADTLIGGHGEDTFVFRAANEAPARGSDEDEAHEGDGGGDDHAGGGQETIADFKPGTDLVDVSAIGSIVAFAAGPATYCVWAEQQGADTMLYVDTDGVLAGDQPAEMSILLLNVDATMLSEGDFLF